MKLESIKEFTRAQIFYLLLKAVGVYFTGVVAIAKAKKSNAPSSCFLASLKALSKQPVKLGLNFMDTACVAESNPNNFSRYLVDVKLEWSVLNVAQSSSQ
jgi:hypothetical protein